MVSSLGDDAVCTAFVPFSKHIDERIALNCSQKVFYIAYLIVFIFSPFVCLMQACDSGIGLLSLW